MIELLQLGGYSIDPRTIVAVGPAYPELRNINAGVFKVYTQGGHTFEMLFGGYTVEGWTAEKAMLVTNENRDAAIKAKEETQ